MPELIRGSGRAVVSARRASRVPNMAKRQCTTGARVLTVHTVLTDPSVCCRIMTKTKPVQILPIEAWRGSTVTAIVQVEISLLDDGEVQTKLCWPSYIDRRHF